MGISNLDGGDFFFQVGLENFLYKNNEEESQINKMIQIVISTKIFGTLPK